ncbi:unnamed protein product [Brassica rapa]|uniref:Uncharacterized protein n=1 Tax=Brassica campestris TaxID=3711 RepID=A0A8D9D7I5_BRACM|nr:unnamed protein product [Brassica rapa]
MYSPRGPKSPEQSTGKASRADMCTDGQRRTSCVC